jgi:hypothetical protein
VMERILRTAQPVHKEKQILTGVTHISNKL